MKKKLYIKSGRVAGVLGASLAVVGIGSGVYFVQASSQTSAAGVVPTVATSPALQHHRSGHRGVVQMTVERYNRRTHKTTTVEIVYGAVTGLTSSAVSITEINGTSLTVPLSPNPHFSGLSTAQIGTDLGANQSVRARVRIVAGKAVRVHTHAVVPKSSSNASNSSTSA
ncbi:MAG: hypothetical protein ACYDHP_10240 [Ferrimicrobium sp.]